MSLSVLKCVKAENYINSSTSCTIIILKEINTPLNTWLNKKIAYFFETLSACSDVLKTVRSLMNENRVLMCLLFSKVCNKNTTHSKNVASMADSLCFLSRLNRTLYACKANLASGMRWQGLLCGFCRLR